MTRSRINVSVMTFLLAASAAACDGTPGDEQGRQTVTESAATAAAESETVLYATKKVTAVQRGDWVRWRFAEPLSTGAENRVYRGKRNKDGDCDFSGTGSLDKKVGDVVVIERATGANANQCLLETERAAVLPQDAAARGLISSEAARTGTRKLGPSYEAGSDLQLESGYTFSGSIQTQIEDPLNIDVADARSNIEWNSNSSCITGWQRWPDWYWFSPTSWYLNNSAETGTSPSSNWCSKVNQTTSGTFYNVAFCLFTLTYVNHNSTQYNALPNGAATWSWSSSWGGLCKGLLSFSVVAH